MSNQDDRDETDRRMALLSQGLGRDYLEGNAGGYWYEQRINQQLGQQLAGQVGGGVRDWIPLTDATLLGQTTAHYVFRDGDFAMSAVTETPAQLEVTPPMKDTRPVVEAMREALTGALWRPEEFGDFPWYDMQTNTHQFRFAAFYCRCPECGVKDGVCGEFTKCGCGRTIANDYRAVIVPISGKRMAQSKATASDVPSLLESAVDWLRHTKPWEVPADEPGSAPRTVFPVDRPLPISTLDERIAQVRKNEPAYTGPESLPCWED